MSGLTVVDAKALLARPMSDRPRRPTSAWYRSRVEAKHQRLASGRKLSDLNPIELWEEFLPIEGGASSFNVVLDTTAPASSALSLNGGATVTAVRAITARLSTTDNPATGYQIIIWGSVDTSVNANIQATEGASAWISPTWTNGAPSFADQAVTLSTGDASKTINARIRDDVWNQSGILTQSITLDTSVPVANITVGPDATKISTVAGKRTVNFSFQSDVAIQAWEVAVVANSGSARGSGTVVGTTNGSTNVTGGALAATTNQAVSIDGRDLSAASAGDGTKVVKVFVQETGSGLWSA